MILNPIEAIQDGSLKIKTIAMKKIQIILFLMLFVILSFSTFG